MIVYQTGGCTPMHSQIYYALMTVTQGVVVVVVKKQFRTSGHIKVCSSVTVKKF